MDPECRVTPVRQTLTTAGRQRLHVLGRAKKKLNLTFYNPKDAEGRRVEYQVQPLVVKGLSLPFILSSNDIKHLKADISMHKESMFMEHPTSKKPLEIKLVGRPGQIVDVITMDNETIPAGCESIIPVQVLGGLTGEEILVEPDETLATQYNVFACCSVNKIRPHKWQPINFSPFKSTIAIQEIVDTLTKQVF